MSVPADSTKTVCGAIKADGKPCQSRVKPGSGPCMWHANTLRQRIRAWARNNTLGFVLTLIFGVVVCLDYRPVKIKK
jgi:hypothetical protein